MKSHSRDTICVTEQGLSILDEWRRHVRLTDEPRPTKACGIVILCVRHKVGWWLDEKNQDQRSIVFPATILITGATLQKAGKSP